MLSHDERATRTLWVAALTGRENAATYFCLGIAELADRDFLQAARSFDLALNLNHPDAQTFLAIAVDKALAQLRGKVGAGDAEAACDLAEILFSGDLGVPREPDEALSIIYRHALQGHSGAQATLGGLLSENGDHQDFERALFWLDKAGAGGDEWAREHCTAITERLRQHPI